MTSFEIKSEMETQLRRIDGMTASECLDYMSSLYDHDLDESSPICELRAEAKSQCRRDYESVLTESERADWRWIEALSRKAPTPA